MSGITVEQLEASLDDSAPPAGLSPCVQALWFEAKGDWHRAHELAQAGDDAESAWVHAYLHRVEGDLGNAAYWYRRAGRPQTDRALREEWRAIAGDLLTR